MKSAHVIRALRHRNYRLFFSGYAVSLVGTWIQSVTTAWLAYRITGSGFWLGVVTFAGQIPVSIISPFGGVLADNHDRRRMVTITQALSMVQALSLAVLFFAGCLTLPLIIVLEIFLGVVKGIDVPVRQAFVLDMVESREDLHNAIALNSTLFNGARLVGPVIAGIMIARVGEGWCFFINGLSFSTVLASLFAMRIPLFVRGEKPDVLAELEEGVRYVVHNPPVRVLLLAVTFFCFLPVIVLYPVYTREILSGDSHTYGLLVSATGLGALLGALFLAGRRSFHGLGTLVLWATFSFSAGAIVLSFARILPLSMGLCVCIGFGMMILNAGSNTILQTISDPDKRGRVVSLWIMFSMGAAPVGSLAGGWISHAIGISATYLITGVAGLAGALAFSFYVPRINKALRHGVR